MTIPLTLSEAIECYCTHLTAAGKSPRTLYTYRRDLDQIQAFFGPEKPLAEIQITQVGKFYRSDDLLRLPDGRQRAEKTVQKTIRVFRMFWVWAQGEGHVKTLPLPKGTPMGRRPRETDQGK